MSCLDLNPDSPHGRYISKFRDKAGIMQFSDLGKTPISDDSPSGQDVRYEPDFEALSMEIAKLSTPSATAAIDWKKVISLSAGILENQSKHLQVVSYFCYALIKTEGMDGLLQGVHILKDVLNNFWDTMYPPKKRMKGRRSIITWWEEKVSEFISNADSVVWKKEKRDQFLNDFNAIDEFLGGKMDDAPLLRPLLNRIKSIVEEEPEAPEEKIAATESVPSREPGNVEKQQTGESSGSGQAGQGFKKTTSSEISIDSGADPFVLLKQGLSILGKSVSGFMKQNPFNPVPYRLNRIVAWSLIDEPPIATGGKTMLPPPDDNIVSSITALYDSSQWQDLADLCESRVRQYLFWLDLSRYVAESMEEMGHQNISEIIGHDTYMFVRMVPGIEKLSFSDGTCFANTETRQWLKTMGSTKASETSESGSATSDSIHNVILGQMNNAQQLIKDKKLDAALKLFIKPMLISASQREQFLWKLGLCRLLIKSKQIAIAASYIDDIIKNIEKYRLEIWEPEIALDALSLAVTGLRLQKKDQHKELIESMINKIAMLDPVKAMEII